MRNFLMDQVCAALFQDSHAYRSSGAGFPSCICPFCIHRLSAALSAAFLSFLCLPDSTCHRLVGRFFMPFPSSTNNNYNSQEYLDVSE
ncbi:MAG: hypothetical protein QNL70_11550 [Pseudomonas sp.]